MMAISRRLAPGSAVAVTLALLMPITAFAVGGAQTTPASVTEQDANPAVLLAGAVMKNFPPAAANATAAEYEAFIVFALSQADYAPDVIDAALTRVSGASRGNDTIALAIENVRKALAKKVLARGTAALTRSTGGVGNGGFGGGTFSAPVVSIGGGSSNYTS